jgi:hypothetical protein
MNTLEIKSLNNNISDFCEQLTDAQMIELTDFICVDYLKKKPNTTILEFIEEFITMREWELYISDKITNPMWLSTSDSTRELIPAINRTLLVQCYTRFTNLVNKPKPAKAKSSDGLNKEDKGILRNIHEEARAMLNYQLEDEAEVIEYGGEEALAYKKAQVLLLDKILKN